MSTTDRLAWSGCCRNCATCITVYPHPFESEVDTVNQIAAGPNEWDAFTSCYVCDGTIEWNGSDPVSAVIR